MFKRVTTEQLKVPAHIDYLADLRDFITRVGRKHGFSDKIVNAFKLAMDEAGTNIIRHAYRGSTGFITIRAIVRKDSLTVALIDQGKYFDPRQVKDPDLGRYVDIGKKGGLGIFIIRKLMDEIDYHKTEEGNELRLSKRRDAPRHPRLKVSVSTIPLTLKARYFLRISAIVTVAIAVGYLYYYNRNDDIVITEQLNQARQVTDLLTSSLSQNQRVMQDDSGLDWFPEVANLYRKFHRDTGGMVHRVFVVNRYGDIFVSSDTTAALWVKYDRPEEATKVQEGIYRYETIDGTEVYDLVTQLTTPESPENVRTLHLQVNKSYIDGFVASARASDLRLALTVLLFAYVGTAILVYVLMNPFRKLADWVRVLGQGESSDEMDIDASTEIGEIAQAFTDITKKFRESQKNLAEQERLQKEMQVAQEIQQTLLPVGFPEVEGYELSSFYEAAKEVGGDYYDFVEVDTDTLGIAVADVSGKGVPGSLVMTMIRTALRTEARGVKDAAEVLARVNEFVMNDMKRGMFVTVFYVIIDSKNRRLNYASAGHNPMILYRPSTNKTYYLNPKGFPIGIQLAEKDLFRSSIESDTIRLAEDDILLIYTDGITEAMNPNRELYGEERLLQEVRENGRLPVTDFVDKLREEIQSFTEGNIQYDDITLVAIKEKTSKEKEELRRAKEAHRLITEGSNIRDACQEAGITTYTYYSKYRRVFEEEGVQAYSIDEDTSVEAKHLSIEEKTKIFDIIRQHPEFGAKRIGQELDSPTYGYTVIPENKIYEELVRSRLNTRQLREAFVARGGRSGRRLKPPGTPMLTLDGKVILDRGQAAPLAHPGRRPSAPPEKAPPTTERPRERAEPVEPRRPSVPPGYDAEIDAQALVTPLDELLDKRREPAAERDEPVSPAAKDQAPISDEKESEESSVSPVEEEDDDILKQLLTEGEPEAADIDQDSADLEFEELIAAGSGSGDPRGLDGEETEPHALGLEGLEDSPAATTEELEEEGEPISAADGAKDDPLAGLDTDDLIEAEILNTLAAEEEAFSAETEGTAATEEVDDEETEEMHAVLKGLFDEDEEEAEAYTEPQDGDGTEEPLDIENIEAESETEALESDVEISEPNGEEYSEIDSDLEPIEELESSLDSEPDFVTDEVTSPDDEDEKAIDFLDGHHDEVFVDLISEPEIDVPAETSSENGSGFVDESDEVLPAMGVEEEETDHGLQPADQPGKRSDGAPSEEPSPAGSQDLDERERMLVSGLRYYREKDYNRAIVEFRKIVEVYPEFKEAHSALGNAYFRNQMYREAEIAYRRVKELDPDEVTAYENMGVILARRGDYDLAVQEWEKALDLNPERTDIVQKIERAQRLMQSSNS